LKKEWQKTLFLGFCIVAIGKNLGGPKNTALLNFCHSYAVNNNSKVKVFCKLFFKKAAGVGEALTVLSLHPKQHAIPRLLVVPYPLFYGGLVAF